MQKQNKQKQQLQMFSSKRFGSWGMGCICIALDKLISRVKREDITKVELDWMERLTELQYTHPHSF